MGHKELYLSKQFSNERTSSMGGGSLQGGDSMVNIVEFEENISPKSRGGRFQENNSIILSTPFRHDEPNDSKINMQHYKTHKAPYSQSVLESNKIVPIGSKKDPHPSHQQKQPLQSKQQK